MFGKEILDSMQPMRESIGSLYDALPDGINLELGKNSLDGISIKRNGEEIDLEFWAFPERYKLIVKRSSDEIIPDKK